MSIRVSFVATIAAVSHSFAVGLPGFREPVASGDSSANTASAVERPILVPLKKLQVPVKRNGTVVSFKYSFAGNISIGAPDKADKQDFLMIFDTGSGQVVVPSDTCPSPACLKHRRYELSKSPGAYAVNSDGSVSKEDRDEATIRYGTGQVTGQFVHDHVCVGDVNASASHRCIEMNLLTATAMSDVPFVEFEFDGIVGLGLESLSVTPQFSFLGRMQSMGFRAQFAIYLAPFDGETGHELAFSGYNHKRIDGPLSWAPLIDVKKGYWQVNITGIRVGNESLAICAEGGCPGILDTGSSHMGMPKGWVSEVFGRLSVPPGDAEDCRHQTSPDLHLDFDGFTLTLGAQDYMRKLPLKNSASAESADGAPVPPTMCRPKLTPVFIPKSFTTHNFFILGEPVFTRYYTVFDFEKKQIGFGLAAHATGQETLDTFAKPNEGILLLQVTFEVTLDGGLDDSLSLE